MLSCGVDIGTTNCKIVLVDDHDRSLWRQIVPTPRLSEDHPFNQNACARSQTTFIATDGLSLFQLIESQILQGWLAVGRGEKLATICTTGVGEDGVYVDEHLQPLVPAIAWCDDSASETSDFIRSHMPYFPQTGIMIDKTRTAARWLWYRRYHPYVAEKSRNWVALVDLPAVIWTGKAFISQTLAARTGCYDVEKRQWVRELLEFCGAPALPAVLSAGTVVGHPVRGDLLCQGVVDDKTLIIAGGHDHPMAASFIWRIEPTARIDSMGTANVIYGETKRQKVPSLDEDIAFGVPLLEQFPKSRTRFSDKKRGLACLGVYEFSAAVKILEEKGINIREFLAQARWKKTNPRSNKARSNKDCDHDDINPEHVFEKAGFALRHMMEKMAEYGVPAGPIFATGGWSRSSSLLELRASIYAKPVYYLEEPEPAAVGAALLGLDYMEAELPQNRALYPYHYIAPNADLVPFYEEGYQKRC